MMKIGQQPDVAPASTQAAPSAQAKTGPVATPPAAKPDRKSSGEGVTVSSSVRTLEKSRGNETPDVDMDKVNAMRQAIEQNTFIVNPESIADKLLANAREMLNRTKS